MLLDPLARSLLRAVAAEHRLRLGFLTPRGRIDFFRAIQDGAARLHDPPAQFPGVHFENSAFVELLPIGAEWNCTGAETSIYVTKATPLIVASALFR
jgi:hypothetical protein